MEDRRYLAAAGTHLATCFFGPGHSLTIAPPADPAGRDRYQVDNAYGRNVFTRWDARNHEGPVGFPDTHASDGRLAFYESSPMDIATEPTGQPVLRLFVASSSADGQFFVYMENVEHAGNVAYVTEELFCGLHRRPGRGNPPYAQLGPWHTFLRADALPLVPGEPAELAFELLPVSYLFPAGHRIRIALSGADRDHVDPLPAAARVADPPQSRVSLASRVAVSQQVMITNDGRLEAAIGKGRARSCFPKPPVLESVATAKH